MHTKAVNFYKNQIIFGYSNNNQVKIQNHKHFDNNRRFIFLNKDPSEETTCKIIKEQFAPKNTY